MPIGDVQVIHLSLFRADDLGLSLHVLIEDIYMCEVCLWPGIKGTRCRRVFRVGDVCSSLEGRKEAGGACQILLPLIAFLRPMSSLDGAGQIEGLMSGGSIGVPILGGVISSAEIHSRYQVVNSEAAVESLTMMNLLVVRYRFRTSFRWILWRHFTLGTRCIEMYLRCE